MRAISFSATVLLVGLIVSLFGAGLGHAQDDKIVRVAADPWCPYNCTPGDEEPGFMIEVGRQAFAMAGYELQYQLMPWSRALRESELGTIDAAIGATRANAPRHTFGRTMLGNDETTLFVRKGETFDFSSTAALEGRRLGVIKDYTYDDNGDIDAYIAENRSKLDRVIVVSSDNNLDLLFRMLMAGRIDAFLENRYVGTYTARSLSLSDRVEVVRTGAIDMVSYAFTPSERGAELARVFDAGVEILRRSGRFAEILADYGLAEEVH